MVGGGGRWWEVVGGDGREVVRERGGGREVAGERWWEVVGGRLWEVMGVLGHTLLLTGSKACMRLGTHLDEEGHV